MAHFSARCELSDHWVRTRESGVQLQGDRDISLPSGLTQWRTPPDEKTDNASSGVPRLNYPPIKFLVPIAGCSKSPIGLQSVQHGDFRERP